MGPMTFSRYHQRGVLRVEERTSTDFESLLKYVAGVNVVLVLQSAAEKLLEEYKVSKAF